LESKIAQNRFRFFLPSLAITEELPIDSNGTFFLPFLGPTYHLKDRPQKMQLTAKPFLKNPSQIFAMQKRKH
jgi:hypothetical protein